MRITENNIKRANRLGWKILNKDPLTIQNKKTGSIAQGQAAYFILSRLFKVNAGVK